MSTQILAAAHNEKRVPDGTYCQPVMAGAALMCGDIPPGYLRDDTGDNISDRNPNFCELTAMYWAWKNLDTDIIGLCHYRRYFASPTDRKSFLRPDEAEHILRVCDVILPKARNYVIETNRSHYANAHHGNDLYVTGKIIEEKHPEYLDAFEKRMDMTSGHRFNMMMMRKALFDEYCCWLFDILFELEERLDLSDHSGNDKRVFGHIAERLLDVWIDARGLRTSELNYIFTGREHLMRKAVLMAARKMRGIILR
ncbi:MAG: DUF4422 domain-containing protein [Mogibacterium sp.]|nr:DUF4422 domain-containing protein [Mogibacterium sp.]